jgi:hypothetical protein
MEINWIFMTWKGLRHATPTAEQFTPSVSMFSCAFALGEGGGELCVLRHALRIVLKSSIGITSRLPKQKKIVSHIGFD